MRKLLKWFLYFLLVVILIVIIYAWPRVPIITGYAAKSMCSGVFVAERQPATITSRDLSFFPINLAHTKVDYVDKSATASLFGLAKRKAVFREGLGCTLLNDFPEDKVREKQYKNPVPSYNPDTLLWPMGSKIKDTVFPEVNYTLLDSVLEAAIDIKETKPVKKTFAVVVVYKNSLLAEAYADEIDRNTRLLGWSMTKSLTNALLGLLVKEGKLKLNQPALVDSWSGDSRVKITIENLMHMNSGLSWDENYFNVSDATKMLYVVGDMYKYAIQNQAIYPPDSVWFYSSGTANILSGIVRNTFGEDQDYYRFPRERLFSRTGMNHTLIEADASGTFVGSSYSYATARDWARFGMLYLNNGIFMGDTILLPGWVDYTTEPVKGSDGTYGALFWLNRSKELKDVPEDMYLCDGFHGQRVFIIPSKDLVVVRLGYSYKNFDFNEFLSAVIKTIHKNLKQP